MKLRRSSLLYALAFAGGLIGLAMAPNPGKWKVADDTRIALYYPKTLGNISRVKVDNTGPDAVLVFAKQLMLPEVMLAGGPNPVPAGMSSILDLPLGAPTVKVVIEDDPMGPDADPDGAKGSLLWLN